MVKTKVICCKCRSVIYDAEDRVKCALCNHVVHKSHLDGIVDPDSFTCDNCTLSMANPQTQLPMVEGNTCVMGCTTICLGSGTPQHQCNTCK